MTINTLSGDAVDDERLLKAILAVYRSAFAPPPWNESEQDLQAYRDRLRADATRPGFRLVTAADVDDVVGFAAAWTTPEPFPNDRSYGRVMAALGPDLVAERLRGALVIDEVAVHSSRQGQGIARRLVEAVAVDEPAWLLTAPRATGAVAFYRRIGWDELSSGGESDVHVFAKPLR